MNHCALCQSRHGERVYAGFYVDGVHLCHIHWLMSGHCVGLLLSRRNKEIETQQEKRDEQ